ncbi:hypothetical protein HYU15_01045 [Candidatus Woesearchaeota archaeon]|nr:hypothetical protein [Candidatus Woesearchaeota archaeon]
MEIIENPANREPEIRRCIERFGHSAEHNFGYFLSKAELGSRSIFLFSGAGHGVMASYSDKRGEVFVISEPLAPKEMRADVLMGSMRACFEKLGCRKFVVEQPGELRDAVLKRLHGSGYCAHKPRYYFYWPVFEMEKWDGDSMQGDKWKNLRNVQNRFFREHSVEVVDSRTVEKGKLLQIVDSWVKRRKALGVGANRKDSNFAYVEPYLHMINAGFRDVKLAKTLVVDGVPSTITAGWDIPNSDEEYYSAVGIFNYGCEGLSEAANLDDLRRLKEMGYRKVDFGGSPKPLLNFKLKFRPTGIYKTFTYAITKTA